VALTIAVPRCGRSLKDGLALALGQHRSAERKPARGRDEGVALTADIIELAKTYGRCGYQNAADYG
jgi:hypothetical protein